MTHTCFVMTKIFCHNKHNFVSTHVFVMTKIFCHNKHNFVSTIFFVCSKHTFVMTNNLFCHSKHVFVAIKIILVVAPANDSSTLLRCWFPGVYFACTAGNERVKKRRSYKWPCTLTVTYSITRDMIAETE